MFLFVLACGDDSAMVADGGGLDAAIDAWTADVPLLDAVDAGNDADRIEYSRPVQMRHGSSELLELDVPEGVLSVGISITRRVSPPDYDVIAVCEWIDPAGQTVVSPDWLAFTDFPLCPAACPPSGPCDTRSTCINPVVTEGGRTAAAVFPSGTVMPSAGTHRIRICARSLFGEVDEEVDLDVVVRTGATPSAGFLDLNLYFTGSRGWTAETSVGVEFETFLDDVFAIYERVGVERGVVTRTNIASPGVVDIVQSDFDFVASLPEAPTGVSVVFVEAMDPEGVLGSSKIPGALSQQQSLRDVTLILVNDDSDLSTLDTVVAHEVGHFLGLGHTSELGAARYFPDAFDDTLSGDERLLMFPGNLGGTYISPQQAQVILRSPHIRGLGE